MTLNRPFTSSHHEYDSPLQYEGAGEGHEHAAERPEGGRARGGVLPRPAGDLRRRPVPARHEGVPRQGLRQARRARGPLHRHESEGE